MDSSFLKRIEYYLEFARKHPKHFANNLGSVKIVFDPQKIYAAEQASLLRNQAFGLPLEGSHVGIISEDPLVTVIRDAVEFSDGDIRLHTRTMNRNNEGVAVLPMFENKIILIRHFRHALRNAMIPIMTIIALGFGHLLSGATLIETMFGWRGMGRLIYESIMGNDYNLALVCLLFTTTMVLIGSIIADISYSVLDPRIRLAGGR